MKTEKWGWTSYKRTPWVHNSGRSIYTVRLSAEETEKETGELCWHVLVIQVAARHIMAALRAICAMADPFQADNTVIN